MKNIIVLILILTLGNTILKSQEEINEKQNSVEETLNGITKIGIPNYYFGIHSGLAFSNIIKTTESNNDYINSSYKTDYNIGVTVDFYSLRRNLPFSIETGIYYIRKGGYQGDFNLVSKDGSITEKQLDLKYIFNYIQVPINLNYNIVWFQNSGINIIGGPFVSYMAYASFKTNESSGEIGYEISYPIDIGFNIGLNYEYKLKSSNIVGVSYNYQFGFNDPIDKNYSNSTHIVNLFYKFY